MDTLLTLLADAWRAAACSPEDADVTLTVHLAERDGVTVAAAVVEGRYTRVSDEWLVAA